MWKRPDPRHRRQSESTGKWTGDIMSDDDFYRLSDEEEFRALANSANHFAVVCADLQQRLAIAEDVIIQLHKCLDGMTAAEDRQS